MDLQLESNDGGAGDDEPDRVYVATSVCHHCSLPAEDQDDGAAGRADIDGLEIGVEYKNRLVHGAAVIWMIIA